MFFWYLDRLIGVNQSRTPLRLPNKKRQHGTTL
jgi:hypothetical protein